jgi:diguanylate cyclase (GGDEF)-like protein
MGIGIMRRLDLLQARCDIQAAPPEILEHDLLQSAIDHAVELTDSQIGYVHYVNPDQQTIELCTWSTSTAAYCSAIYDRHYPIERAGIWADTARLRRPQIHNDYASESTRRGLPEGHAPLVRHLGVPVLAQDAVHLLLGVGNARRAYDDDDVFVAQTIADTVWAVTVRLREYAAMRSRLRLIEQNQQVIRHTTWEWDPETGAVQWDESTRDLIAGFDSADQSWEPLLRALASPARVALEAVLSNPPADPLSMQVQTHPGRGQPLTLRLQGYWDERPQGRGRIMRGILIDVTVLADLELAHDKATHDTLTGLPNRAWLLQDLTSRLATRGSRSTDHFAVHFIDFDGFKAINDQHGHLAGDAVLRECSHRLQAMTRAGEVVARFGGDEFVLVQNGPVTPASATALARRIRRGISEAPVSLGDGDVPVNVSVGVALRTGPGPTVDGLLDRADRALYAAKEHPEHVVVVP